MGRTINSTTKVRYRKTGNIFFKDADQIFRQSIGHCARLRAFQIVNVQYFCPESHRCPGTALRFL